MDKHTFNDCVITVTKHHLCFDYKSIYTTSRRFLKSIPFDTIQKYYIRFDGDEKLMIIRFDNDPENDYEIQIHGDIEVYEKLRDTLIEVMETYMESKSSKPQKKGHVL